MCKKFTVAERFPFNLFKVWIFLVMTHYDCQYTSRLCKVVRKKHTFIYRKDLETVLNRAYHLRGKPFGTKEQFPGEVEANRKKLYPVMKKAKQDGKRVNPS